MNNEERIRLLDQHHPGWWTSRSTHGECAWVVRLICDGVSTEDALTNLKLAVLTRMLDCRTLLDSAKIR